ncbi:MAG: MazG nucleotide pyrophosphohydrolase domain-containing protein [Negativibacillus sp.]
MDGKTTVKYLQTYSEAKDHHPELVKDYFPKLAEEVGELSRAVRKGTLAADSGNLKGSIDEELWDVMYYALALANCYEIDMEQVIRQKEELNRIKYQSAVAFEENR